MRFLIYVLLASLMSGCSPKIAPSVYESQVLIPQAEEDCLYANFENILTVPDMVKNYAVTDLGIEVYLRGGNWIAVYAPLVVGPTSTLSFSVRDLNVDSTEILAIGLVQDLDSFEPSEVFQLGGTETYGNQAFRGLLNGPGEYCLPIGLVYEPGERSHFVLIQDYDLDREDFNISATFESVKFCATPNFQCSTPIAAPSTYNKVAPIPNATETAEVLPGEKPPYFKDGQIFLPGTGKYTVWDFSGNTVAGGTGDLIDVSSLPNNKYLVEFNGKLTTVTID